MSGQTFLSFQTDETASVHSQFEFMPIYEEKIGQIKEEFQSTVTGIQSAMMLAIRNYDKKCNDNESLVGQLNVEKSKTQMLEDQVERLNDVIKEKDALILKLQHCRNDCKHSGVFNLSAIDQLKKEIAESIKSNAISKKNNRNFKSILRTFSSPLKSERENSDKAVKSAEKKVSFISPQRVFKRRGSNASECSNMDQNQKSPFRDCMNEAELDVKKACKDRTNMALELFIQKNNAVIDELKVVQQSTKFSRNVENENQENDQEVQGSYVKQLEDRLNELEAERQQFPQQILAKLKEMDDHLNDIIYKNRQLYEMVQFLTDERQTLKNEIKILQQLSADHDEVARKYLRAKKFHQSLIHQKSYLMIELNAYKSIENSSKVTTDDLGIKSGQKIRSFKSIALAAVAIARMQLNSAKKYTDL